jgi:hypothetical protein
LSSGIAINSNVEVHSILENTISCLKCPSRERKIVDHVKSISPFFQEGMREAISDSPIVGEVIETAF